MARDLKMAAVRSDGTSSSCNWQRNVCSGLIVTYFYYYYFFSSLFFLKSLPTFSLQSQWEMFWLSPMVLTFQRPAKIYNFKGQRTNAELSPRSFGGNCYFKFSFVLGTRRPGGFHLFDRPSRQHRLLHFHHVLRDSSSQCPNRALSLVPEPESWWHPPRSAEGHNAVSNLSSAFLPYLTPPPHTHT